MHWYDRIRGNDSLDTDTAASQIVVVIRILLGWTMEREVFISYSSSDRSTADTVCAALEGAGIACWIAPRDILPSTNWAESIIDAISRAHLVILVLSSSANASPQVEREVERAANSRVPIIPMRIDDIQPSSALSYFISNAHWLDAFAPPLEQHLKYLTRAAHQILERQKTAQGDTERGSGVVPRPAQPNIPSIVPRLREATNEEKVIFLARMHSITIITTIVNLAFWMTLFFAAFLSGYNLSSATKAALSFFALPSGMIPANLYFKIAIAIFGWMSIWGFLETTTGWIAYEILITNRRCIWSTPQRIAFPRVGDIGIFFPFLGIKKARYKAIHWIDIMDVGHVWVHRSPIIGHIFNNGYLRLHDKNGQLFINSYVMTRDPLAVRAHITAIQRMS